MRFLLPLLFRRILGLGLVCALLGVAGIVGANYWVCQRARERIVTALDRLPVTDVALVLGTSKFSSDGSSSNPFFHGRINTAAQLYHAEKVRHLLVSGDNSRVGYDEPTWMRDALLELGVPAAAITADYAGFRTLDSVARAKAVFGLSRVAIVTDDFHLPRALFLADSLGLDAVGFPSERVPYLWSKKTRIREIASRVKACLDVYVLRTQPRFFGPSVEIQLGTFTKP